MQIQTFGILSPGDMGQAILDKQLWNEVSTSQPALASTLTRSIAFMTPKAHR